MWLVLKFVWQLVEAVCTAVDLSVDMYVTMTKSFELRLAVAGLKVCWLKLKLALFTAAMMEVTCTLCIEQTYILVNYHWPGV